MHTADDVWGEEEVTRPFALAAMPMRELARYPLRDDDDKPLACSLIEQCWVEVQS